MGFGITLGANMTNEVTTFEGLSSSEDVNRSLKGLVIGMNLEMMIPKYDAGLQLSSMYSRKGSNFSYKLDNSSYGLLLDGYRNVEYLEVPVVVKWRFGPRDFKAYVLAGYFWGFALGGTVDIESAIDELNGSVSLPELEKSSKMEFGDEYSKYNFIDHGYTVGAGINVLQTIELGIYYAYSLKSLTNEDSMEDLLKPTYSYNEGDFNNMTRHSTVSVRLTYIISKNKRR